MRLRPVFAHLAKPFTDDGRVHVSDLAPSPGALSSGLLAHLDRGIRPRPFEGERALLGRRGGAA